MVAVRSFVLAVLVAACQREKPQPVESAAITPVVPATATGNAACDDYLRRVAACTKLSPAMRDALAYGGGVWKQAVDQQGAAATAAAESCASVANLAAPSLTELGC